MPITYRTTDGAKWGTGKGSNLTATEVDENFWDVAERVRELEDNPPVAVGIDSVSVDGNAFSVTLTDSTVLGPFALPQISWDWKGEWTAATPYLAYDTVEQSGTVYLVQIGHTSEAPFDPDRLISGEQVYKALFEVPTGGGGGGGGSPVLEVGEISASGTYNPTLADANKYLRCTNAAGVNVAIPSNATVAFPIGTELSFRQSTTTGVVFVYNGSGATLDGEEDNTWRTKWLGDVITVKKVGTNAWDIFGDDDQAGTTVYLPTNEYIPSRMDNGSFFLFDHSTGIALELPTDTGNAYDGSDDIAPGFEFKVMQYGAGPITFSAASGAVVYCSAAFTLVSNGTNSVQTVRKIESNTWVVYGDLVPA